MRSGKGAWLLPWNISRVVKRVVASMSVGFSGLAFELSSSSGVPLMSHKV